MHPQFLMLLSKCPNNGRVHQAAMQVQTRQSGNLPRVCAIVLCHQSGSLIWAKALHALHKPHGWATPPLNDAVMELRSGFMTPFAVLLSLDSASQVLIIPSGMQH